MPNQQDNSVMLEQFRLLRADIAGVRSVVDELNSRPTRDDLKPALPMTEASHASIEMRVLQLRNEVDRINAHLGLND